ncbi:MAG: 4-hydroxy-tetrahydrodipicolinate synthase, partial [Actinobacteria bacterium]|nr:4-hydroxy-tetrahydrodipicolinate synthase [Actinomycetota bacterium]NIT94248.1 4-hydroxy-tetrahydrodipicolinate synthase [Actinomycetota bacterium]NIV54350.1 4-hydroxy-tetrahydrodipicolinate synthase [Actinomycetota bacterium]NIV85660.1 4-hydroxy-tetrahydrodipicolinate synthase [Actinomycetota bacterium]NIX49233.1 4-hydroxy-tetrahydrodipicolinate synthase [Actinomycetota bacterium]
DWDLARRLHLALYPLNKALFLEPNPMPLKAALNALWEPVGDPRLPLVPASDDTVKAVKEALTVAQAV